MPIFHKCDLRLLPDGRLDRLFLLFPDPWAKSRHAKRRFVHPALLPLLARTQAGRGVAVASDDPTFQARMAEVMVEQIRFDVTTPATERPADWPPTRYETKAVREGLARQYWTFAPR
jgi:tRNA (guanine-N7-)-methyltransferase